VAKNVKEVCQLDTNPLIQPLSSSLNPGVSTFLASVVSNTVCTSLRAGGRAMETGVGCLYPEM
jgi:hypothetical protein